MSLRVLTSSRVCNFRTRTLISAFFLFALIGLAAVPAAAEGNYDSNPAWPLCGRITEDPPTGWTEDQGCPSKRWGADYTDEPLSDTFGPRLLSGDYDFHRGIDIDADWDTPVFSIADGEIKSISSGTTNITLTVRHFAPGYTTCGSGDGCYHSRYVHLSSVKSGLKVGDDVDKGDLIGYVGASSKTATPHLHFEIRDAYDQDAYSYWQRDCIHPLAVLPYDDDGANNISLNVTVDDTDPTVPGVTIQVQMPVGYELDLVRVEAIVYENQSGTLVEVSQSNHLVTGNTIEDTPYDVNPPWFDMNIWNRQYTYKDSSSYPFSDFEVGGTYESPYASDADFPTSYDAGHHMDNATATDPGIGEFNGALVAPVNLTSSSTHYDVSFAFTELVGVTNQSDLCVEGKAVDVAGNSTSVLVGNCS